MNQNLSNKIHFTYKFINLFFMNLLIDNLLNFFKSHKKNILIYPWSRDIQFIFVLEILLASGMASPVALSIKKQCRSTHYFFLLNPLKVCINYRIKK